MIVKNIEISICSKKQENGVEDFDKKKIRCGTMALATTLLLGGFSSLTASASEVDTQQPYLWNEETKTIKDLSTVVEDQVKDETIINEPRKQQY